MKRNVISLLVAAMVLIGLIAFVTPTAEAADTDPILYHCICGNKHSTALTDGEITWKEGTTKCYDGCDGVIHEWTKWDANSKNGDGGYFYYGSDIASAREFNGTGDAGDKYYIDLSGHNIAVASARAIFTVSNCELVFCNTQTAGGTISGGLASSGEGGAINVASGGSLTLYGLNVASTSTVATNGGAVNVKANSTFKMVGGSITGATASNCGGALCVYGANSVAELRDVTITGGTAKYGGNISVGIPTNGSQNGNLILCGTTAVSGGNDTANQGGNILSYGTVTLKDDVVVFGGKNNGNADNARNIRLMGVTTAHLIMQDRAAVDAGVTVSANGKVTLSGNVQIHHDVDSTVGVATNRRFFTQGSVIDATGLTGGARIDCEDTNLFAKGTNFAKVTDASVLTCFNGKTIALKPALVEESGVKYVRFVDAGSPYHCICGNVHSTAATGGTLSYRDGAGKCMGTCDGTILTWTAWDGTDTSAPATGSNVYLVKDRTTNMVVKGNSFNLDLNGFDWNAGAGQFKALAIAAGGADGKYVNICNSSDKASRITGMDTRETNGGVIGLTQNYTLNLYNVNVEADAETESQLKDGGAIYISDGTFNMYGGSVVGQTVSGNGGAIYTQSLQNVTLEDVDISGGTAQKGGSIYITNTEGSKDATVFLKGSTSVHGGVNTANDQQDGNIFINCGTLDMSGNAQVYDGKWGVQNRNIQLGGNNAALVMSGNAQADGGVVAGFGSVTLSGDVQIHNDVDAAGKANERTLYLAAGVVVDATGLTSDARIDLYDCAASDEGRKVATVGATDVSGCFNVVNKGTLYNAGWCISAEADGIWLRQAATEVNGIRYANVADAVTAANGTGIVKLMSTVDGATIAANTNLDLNGYSLTNVTIPAGVTVNGMDSTTNLYGDTNAVITGTINGTVAPSYTDNSGTNLRRYLAVPVDGGYAFHRIYVAITAVSVTPADTGLNYKLAFIGNKAVADYINNTENVLFGLKATGEQTAYGVSETGFKAYENDENVANYTTRTAAIKPVLVEGDADNQDRATLDITAQAVVVLKNGDSYTDLVVSAGNGTTRNFKQMVLSADAAWGAGTLTNEALKTALSKMYTDWSSEMEGWGIQNITKTA